MDLSIRILGKQILEVRSGLSSIKNPAEWMRATLGFDTSSGISVNEETALTFSAVWGCIQILSNTFGMLPLGVYRHDGDSRLIQRDHQTHYLIHKEPNQIMSSFNWRRAMMAQAGLWGNSYSHIIRDSNAAPREVILIEKPSDVNPEVVKNKLWYTVNGIKDPIRSEDMLHFSWLSLNGYKGRSPVRVARENIGLALAMQQYGGKVFRTGGSKRIAFTSAGKMNPELEERLKKSWRNKYAGVDNIQEPAFLDGATDIKEIGMDPEDAQFLGSRKFSIEEVARIYGVQLHLLQSLERATNNNIEHQSIEFVTHTMTPHLVNAEQEMNRKLFREDEKRTHYTKFNVAGLLRGDVKTRGIFYRVMADLGVYSINHILRLEDENPIPGGDKHYIQMNRIDIDKADKLSVEEKARLLEAAAKPTNGGSKKETVEI